MSSSDEPFPFDESPIPVDVADESYCSDESLQDRAEKALTRNLPMLPRLTKAHRAVVVRMMIAAYRAGQRENALMAKWNSKREMRQKARKAVQARRQQSKRLDIIRTFKAAATKKIDVSIDELARQHGVSRATAYRALNSMTARKPTPSAKK